MRRRQKRKLIAEINVVPYIDVTLVLLVVFMAAVPLVMQAVDVDLPKVSAKPIKTQVDEPLVVSMNEQGEVFINLGAEPDKPLATSVLQEQVRKILKAKPETQVMVWGDQRADYGKVVSLMAALQTAGAESVGLVTEPGAFGEP